MTALSLVLFPVKVLKSKPVKRCSASSATREMHVVTTMRCQFTSNTAAVIKEADGSSVGRGKSSPHALLVGMQNGVAASEKSQLLHVKFPQNPAMPFLRHYSRATALVPTHNLDNTIHSDQRWTHPPTQQLVDKQHTAQPHVGLCSVIRK